MGCPRPFQSHVCLLTEDEEERIWVLMIRPEQAELIYPLVYNFFYLFFFFEP